MSAFWFVVWYVFSLPLVFALGFPSLLIAHRLRHGPILVPPIVGTVAGVVFAVVTYSQGMNKQGLILFSFCGLATATVAALLYFKLLDNGSDVSSL
jgi:hypothetical protein